MRSPHLFSICFSYFPSVYVQFPIYEISVLVYVYLCCSVITADLCVIDVVVSMLVTLMYTFQYARTCSHAPVTWLVGRIPTPGRDNFILLFHALLSSVCFGASPPTG